MQNVSIKQAKLSLLYQVSKRLQVLEYQVINSEEAKPVDFYLCNITSDLQIDVSLMHTMLYSDGIGISGSGFNADVSEVQGSGSSRKNYILAHIRVRINWVNYKINQLEFIS